MQFLLSLALIPFALSGAQLSTEQSTDHAPMPPIAYEFMTSSTNMSLAPWAAQTERTESNCFLISDTGFSCIWDCNGTWVITDTSDCSIPPSGHGPF